MKQVLSFLLRLVPMILKCINNKLFPIKQDQLVVTVESIELNKPLDRLRLKIKVKNYNYADLDMKNLRLKIVSEDGLFINYNYPILRELESRVSFEIDFSVVLTSKQLKSISKFVEKEEKPQLEIEFNVYAREKYFNFEYVREFFLSIVH